MLFEDKKSWFSIFSSVVKYMRKKVRQILAPKQSVTKHALHSNP